MTEDEIEIYNLVLKNETLWKKGKMLDIEHIQLRKQIGKKFSDKFLTTNPIGLKEKSRLYRVSLLSEYYKGLCFFGTEEVKSKFVQLGVTRCFLDHFIPLDSVLIELDKIEAATGTRMFRMPAIFLIQWILEAKIFTEMLQWGGYVEVGPDGMEKVSLLRMLENLYRQRKYQEKYETTKSESFNSLMQEQLDFIEFTLGNKKISKKTLLQSLSGKTVTFYLKQLFEGCFWHENNEVPKHFYGSFFDLLKLITKHPKMYNEPEYKNLPDGKYYGKSYNWYKNHIVKKIIYQK